MRENTHIEKACGCPLCACESTVRLATRTVKGRQWHVARCSSCGLVFTDPQPTEQDIQRFYDGDYHADLRRPGAAESMFGQKFDSYCDWLVRYVQPGKSLDVGCATGLLVKKLQDRGFQAEGYEANVLSAEWGSAHYGVRIHIGHFDPANSKLGTYDLITLCDVLEHTVNPLEYLRAASRFLRPGGHVFVTFPHIWSPESLYYRAVSKLLRREWMWHSCSVPYHTWEFTPNTARSVFDKAGFRVVSFRRKQDTIKRPVINMRDPMSLVRIPTRMLWFPPLGNRFGVHMHSLLQPR